MSKRVFMYKISSKEAAQALAIYLAKRHTELSGVTVADVVVSHDRQQNEFSVKIEAVNE